MNEITAAYRTHNNGELRAAHIGNRVKLSGWVQKVRDKGGMMWIDLRDRYGVTQLVLEEGKTSTAVIEAAKSLGREFVITIEGEVIERYAKNDKIPTGEVEVFVSNIAVINKSETPPFTIEDESDGGDEIRMKYRYLDLRRNPVKEKIMLRHTVAQATRSYLSGKDFLEIETPFLIKSTPEGARDFVVPSRMNENEILEIIKLVYEKFDLILDPHSAIGYGAFDKVNIDGNNIVLATAHPSKFPEAIKKSINLKSDLPQELRFVMDEKENYDIMENNIDKVKHHIKERIQ